MNRSGKWESRLLKLLANKPAFDPVEAVEADRYTKAEYNAINRAAHNLHRKGLVDLHRVWKTNRRGRRTAYLWVFRPGVTPAELDIEPAVTAYER